MHCNRIAGAVVGAALGHCAGPRHTGVLDVTFDARRQRSRLRQVAEQHEGLADEGPGHAESKKFDVNNLVGSRLAVDMLPFSAQILIACDNAKNGCARLAGVEAPRFEDDEKTVAELVARIEKTVGYLETLGAAQFEGSETKDITHPSRSGDKHFKGQDYLLNHILPNFWFHASMTYALLRHNGVEIGKKDFMGAY